MQVIRERLPKKRNETSSKKRTRSKVTKFKDNNRAMTRAMSLLLTLNIF